MDSTGAVMKKFGRLKGGAGRVVLGQQMLVFVRSFCSTMKREANLYYAITIESCTILCLILQFDL